MPELSSQAQQTIDALSLGELSYEIHLGAASRFQRANFAYLEARYKQLLAQSEDEQNRQVLSLAKAANDIAGETNDIAKGAACTAKYSFYLAILALIVSGAGVVVAFLHK